MLAYGGLLGLAILWSCLRGDPGLLQPAGHTPVHPFWAALAGTAVGLVVALLSQISVRRFRWAARLELEFARILGPMTGWTIFFLAVASSVAEEAFFRGAMQPSIGIVLASAVFGLLHVGPAPQFLPWTALALVMGFVLGALYLWTDTLMAPILCHGWINAINLRRIALRARADREHPSSPRA
jgi:membrane protease YdiL (CAAX protease family)